MTDNLFVEINGADVGIIPETNKINSKQLIYEARKFRFIDTIQHGFEKVFSFVREIHRIMNI